MKSQPGAKFFASVAGMMAILTTCVHAQSGNWDPYVHSVTISPAPLLPLEFNGTGVASLRPGNNGGTDLPLGNPNGQDSNDLMIVTVSLANGVPNVADPSDPVQALNALGGPGKIYWDWTYFPDTQTFRGVQNRPIPAYTAEEVTIQYKVTVNTFNGASPFAFNGLNVNIQPPGYTNPQTTDNDKASSYTYVEAKDFGDAPSTYGEAVHTIDVTKDADGFYNHYIFMGHVVDPEPAYQASSDARGDDNNQTGGLGVNDEDGVTFPVMTRGTTVTIPVVLTIVDGDQTGYAGWLSAWFDWNGDGSFTNAGERVATNVYVDYSVLGGATGTVNLQVTVPSNAKVGQTFARFRFGPSLTGTNAPYKPAAYGEVEDYQVTIQSQYVTIGDFVWQDTNGNGIQDDGEPGLSNVTVRLLGAATNVLATTVTSTNGGYSFTNLNPGTYYVEVVAPTGYVFTTLQAGTNTAVDSDVQPASGRTAALTLALGDNRTDVDAGLYVPPRLFGYGFTDMDGNLVYNASEGDTPVANMTVSIWTNGIFVASTNTSATGYYEFDTLVPATYQVRFLCSVSALVQVPTTPPASTNTARNRAAAGNGYGVAVYTVVSGSGVAPNVGEPINVGFRRGAPTASSVAIQAYAVAGGVVVEFETTDETGQNPIVLYLFRNGQWVEVGCTNAVGEGDNRYQFVVPGLNAGDVCNLAVQDDEGQFYVSYGIVVGSFATQAVLMDRNGIWLQWQSIPGRTYDIYQANRLDRTWTMVKTVVAGQATTTVCIPVDASQTAGFYRIGLRP